MRWPFGPPHMTLKPSKKNTTKKTTKIKNKKEKNKKKQEKTKNTQKWAFQLSVKIFFFFGWVSKISLFWQLGPKSAHTKNTIKIVVSRPFFWKAVVRHETAIFGPKKANFINSSYHFFLPIFQQHKTQKIAETPIFYSVLANLKKEIFQNLNLKHWKLKNPILAPFFLKKAIFRKLPENWGQKQNTKW